MVNYNALFNTSSASAVRHIFPPGVTREPGNKEKKEPQVTQVLEGQKIACAICAAKRQ